jgi:hypothetical protein
MEATVYDMAVSPIPWDIGLLVLLFMGFGVLVELLSRRLKKRKKEKLGHKDLKDKG